MLRDRKRLGRWGISILMSRDTRFTKIIRIDPKQKKYIRQNRKKNNCRTDAGFLDKIINFYKQYGNQD